MAHHFVVVVAVLIYILKYFASILSGCAQLKSVKETVDVCRLIRLNIVVDVL